MANSTQTWSLKELAETIGGTLVGNPNLLISRPVPAGVAAEDGITFATNSSFLEKALSVKVGAIVAPQSSEMGGRSGILVENPRASFAGILQLFAPVLELEYGIHPSANVHPEAFVASSAQIGPNVTIGPNVSVGEQVKIHAGCFVGPNCLVAEGTILMPNATLVVNVTLGKNCLVHPGAVIGADGFGFEWDGNKHVKIPQIGGVLIGDNVEIGANSCIDRGALENTVIGSGTKVDNLCQIGHNVEIGSNSILAGMVGIGGSAKIGNQFIAGSNAGIKDHVSIADNVVLGGRTGVATDIKDPGVYFGSPPLPISEGLRVFALVNKLPEIWKRLKKLEDAQKDGEKL